MKCSYCNNGDIPHILDSDGVQSSISGMPGRLMHSHEDSFWECENRIKSEEEYQVMLVEAERLIDLDPDKDILEGRRLAAITAVISEYERERFQHKD